MNCMSELHECTARLNNVSRMWVSEWVGSLVHEEQVSSQPAKEVNENCRLKISHKRRDSLMSTGRL